MDARAGAWLGQCEKDHRLRAKIFAKRTNEAAPTAARHHKFIAPPPPPPLLLDEELPPLEELELEEELEDEELDEELLLLPTPSKVPTVTRRLVRSVLGTTAVIWEDEPVVKLVASTLLK